MQHDLVNLFCLQAVNLRSNVESLESMVELFVKTPQERVLHAVETGKITRLEQLQFNSIVIAANNATVQQSPVEFYPNQWRRWICILIEADDDGGCGV